MDLTKEKITKRPLNKEVAINFIGGRGLNGKVLFDEIGTQIDPLSPENILCLSVGPFTGTSLPQTSRIEVSTLSPNRWVAFKVSPSRRDSVQPPPSGQGFSYRHLF